MFKIKSKEYLKDMGFTPKGEKGDYVCLGVDDDGFKRALFRLYMGSPYIRCAASTYATDAQLKLIHEWTKQDYIEWED